MEILLYFVMAFIYIAFGVGAYRISARYRKGNLNSLSVEAWLVGYGVYFVISGIVLVALKAPGDIIFCFEIFPFCIALIMYYSAPDAPKPSAPAPQPEPLKAAVPEPQNLEQELRELLQENKR